MAIGDQFPPQPQYGWICPRCGKVNGPHVTHCDCLGGLPASPLFPPLMPPVVWPPAEWPKQPWRKPDVWMCLVGAV
jgi:hypothetical protein